MNRIRYTSAPVTFLAAAILSASPGIAGAGQVLTVDQALAIAMENSPTMMRSKLTLDRSRESLNAQNAALKSSFSLTLTPISYSSGENFEDNGSYWYTNRKQTSASTFAITQPISQTDGELALTNSFSWQDSRSEALSKTSTDKSFINSLSLSFTQPIFTYNRTKLTLRELELDLENSALAYALQKLSLESQVKQNFYTVFESKASLDISREELKNQQQSYDIIKRKVEAGLSAQEELYQAELNLASSEATVQNNEVSLDNALDTFKQLIGMPVTEEISIDADISYKPVEVVLERAIDHALKSRMELRQKNIAIETAQNNVLTASAENEFKGSVSVSLGLTGTDGTLGSVYDTPTKNKTAAVSFTIPLWDWGAKKSKVNASKLSLKSSEISFDEQKTDIVIAIRQAYRNLNNLAKQIEIAEKNVRNAQLTYEINLERYKNGDLTSMDLNDYQTQLSSEKTSLTSAQINYKLAVLNLKILTLWDYENNAAVSQEALMK